MNNFKSAAIAILEQSKTPLHYKAITRLALEQGLLHTEGKTPDATMNAQLVTDINAKGNQSNFVKTAPGTYTLNTQRTQPAIAVKKLILPLQLPEKVDSGFVGKGGEHYVTSELLFRGYNASIMSVDVGMDIIATKHNKLFSLQVKTSNLHSTNVYIFDMRKVSLERNYAGNVFYVFVMLHPDGQKSALILDSNRIDELIHSNAIKDVKNQDKFRVTLKIRNNKIYIGTLDNEINYYWNNWGIIK